MDKIARYRNKSNCLKCVGRKDRPPIGRRDGKRRMLYGNNGWLAGGVVVEDETTMMLKTTCTGSELFSVNKSVRDRGKMKLSRVLMEFRSRGWMHRSRVSNVLTLVHFSWKDIYINYNLRTSKIFESGACKCKKKKLTPITAYMHMATSTTQLEAMQHVVCEDTAVALTQK
ncbi:hypothetical protein CEXT_606481 [Caerostris extrusa]|uniref:Uncharacterized protein n=1 Tax=Caerostris extrusa TaxID=172846 RepID=A0AAV4N1L3_CAEEX|nr:hypothetical protein CEXT_606481 [Caerostris extrusa]